ncbi:hypothetical protein LINGRAHAP2_LOCUS19197 [Linum grandiflorum]
MVGSSEMKVGKVGNRKGTENSEAAEEESASDEVIEVCPVKRQFYDLYDDDDEELELELRCPDPEFYDFGKDRADDCLDVDQIWAMYDEADAMPRYYGRVKKLLKENSLLLISWLEASPVTEDEQDWHDQELPISCGRFEIGEEEVLGRLSLSHRVDTKLERSGNSHVHVIYPNKGETWAIFKNWDVKWCCKPELHKPPYSYDLVEILSDFTQEAGVRVGVLSKVGGFVSIFRRGMDMEISFCVRPKEVLRFSHRVPSRRMTGKERQGVPAGSFELDTAALPSNLANCRVYGQCTDKLDITDKPKNQLETGQREQHTFWTCCQSCKVKFQCDSRFLNCPMSCQNCRRTFVAHDAGFVAQQGSSDVQAKRKRSDSLCHSDKQMNEAKCDSKKLRSEDELGTCQAELATLKGRIETCKTWLKRTRVSIQERQGELRSIEEKIEETNSKHNDCVDKQEAELAALEERIKESKKELETNDFSVQEEQRQKLVRDCNLQSIEESIKEANLKLEDRKKQCNVLKKSISECTVDLRSKQRQLKGIKQSIQESTMKEKALSYVKDAVKECCQALESKEKELDDVKKSIEAANLVLEVKVKQLNEVKAKVVHNVGKLKAMDEHQHRIKKTIMDLKRKRQYYQSVQKPSQELSAATFMKDQVSEKFRLDNGQIRIVVVLGSGNISPI